MLFIEQCSLQISCSMPQYKMMTVNNNITIESLRANINRKSNSPGVLRNNNAVHNCCANLRVRFNDTPLKFVFLSRSYRLYESNSNTRHRWFRHIKCLFNFTENKRENLVKRWKNTYYVSYNPGKGTNQPQAAVRAIT